MTTDINKITGNIHLPHLVCNETKMINLFNEYSKKYAITRESDEHKVQHYHFYIETKVKDTTLKDYLIKQFPEIKQSHLKTDKLNKDGTKKCWERRIKIKIIKPSAKSILDFDQEYQLIQYYVYKDISPDTWKPISKNITIEEMLEMKTKYYELVKLYHDTSSSIKKTKKQVSQNIIIEYEKLLKDKLQSIGVDGKPVILNLTEEDAVSFVLKQKKLSNKTININVLKSIIQTLLIRNNRKYYKELKQKLIDEIKIN